MNKKNICVLDFETLSTNPRTTEFVQLSALMIDPLRLETLKGSEFNSYSRPDGFMNDEATYLKWKPTIDWHCKNQNWTKNQFMTKIENSSPEKVVWESFMKYLSKYHTKPSHQTIFSAPILSGWNSFGFDFKILDRLCVKYKNLDKDGNPNIYLEKDLQDIMKIMFLWFENSAEVTSYAMDATREFFGMSMENAHDGIKDVRDEAALFIKFLKLHRQVYPRVPFKNSFAK